MLIFNWIGAGMTILGVVVGIIAGSMLGGKSDILVGGIAMIAIDLVYRSISNSPFEFANLLYPKRGGNLFFIPVWIIGAFLLFVELAQ